MMMNSTADEFRTQVAEKIKEGNFNALVSPLAHGEQLVLFALLKNNQAMPIRGIRDFIIYKKAWAFKSEILLRFGFPFTLEIADVPVETKKQNETIKYSDAVRKKIGNIKIEESKVSELLSLLKKNDKKDEFRINLLKSFTSDEFLLRYNIKTLSFTKKVKVWESALKGMIDLPSWNFIKSSLESLMLAGLVKKRIVSGKKSEMLYFVLPMIYEIWEAKRKELTEKISKDYKPSDLERDWFLD